jgi:hypothetical protein
MDHELRKRGTGADLTRSPYDLGADWIKANVVAAAATFVLGIATFALRQILGLPDPNAGAFANALQAIAEVLAAATGFGIYAARTGAVLHRKLPDFPPLTWNALHILIGCGVGAVVAFIGLSAEPATRESAAVSSILSIAIGGMMTGAVIGAAAGGMQALVLRKAAREVGDWIRWSALAGTTFGAYALVLAIESDQPLTDEVLSQLLGAAVAIAAGFTMLPAVYRLQPRSHLINRSARA